MISIWAINGCHSDVLFVRKFEINYQSFVITYDIEITIPIFLFTTKSCFTRKATPL